MFHIVKVAIQQMKLLQNPKINIEHIEDKEVVLLEMLTSMFPSIFSMVYLHATEI